MKEEDGGVIEVERMVLSNQRLNVLGGIVGLESDVLLLAIIHITNHSLNLGRVMEDVGEVIHIVHHGIVPFSILACK